MFADIIFYYVGAPILAHPPSPTPGPIDSFLIGSLGVKYVWVADLLLPAFLSFVALSLVLFAIDRSKEKSKALAALSAFLIALFFAAWPLLGPLMSMDKLLYSVGLIAGGLLAFWLRMPVARWLGTISRLERAISNQQKRIQILQSEVVEAMGQATTATWCIKSLAQLAISMKKRQDDLADASPNDSVLPQRVLSRIASALTEACTALGGNVADSEEDMSHVEELGIAVCFPNTNRELAILFSTHLQGGQVFDNSSQSIVFRAYEDREVLHSKNDMQFTRSLTRKDGRELPLTTRVAIPLIAHDKVVGVLFADRSEREDFSEPDCDYLKAIAALIAEPLSEVVRPELLELSLAPAEQAQLSPPQTPISLPTSQPS
jgi:GAF domain